MEKLGFVKCAGGGGGGFGEGVRMVDGVRNLFWGVRNLFWGVRNLFWGVRNLFWGVRNLFSVILLGCPRNFTGVSVILLVCP